SPRGGHVRRLHDLLGEGLRAFEHGRFRAGPEDGERGLSQGIGDPGDQGRLGADDDEIDVERFGQRGHGVRVRGIDGLGVGDLRDPGVAGCGDDGVDLRVARESEDEGVFTGARTDDKNLHGTSLKGRKLECVTSSTFTPAHAAELAVVIRSGFTESRHIGSAVVLDPQGTPLIRLGAPEVPVFTRSSLKPLQAIAAMSLGAELSGPAAALAKASHQSEAGQVEARASGDAETDPRSALHFNCSGKHTAFLAAARAIGAETSTYLSADHPVQSRVAEVVETFASETPAAVGIDGCGAPVFALSLNG